MRIIRPLILVLFIATSVFAKGTAHTSGSHASGSRSSKSTASKSKGTFASKSKGSSTKSTAKSSGATNKNTVHVNSYKKKNGTIVQAHSRTAPNKTQKDNWSTKGHVNPNTGKAGTKQPKN